MSTALAAIDAAPFLSPEHRSRPILTGSTDAILLEMPAADYYADPCGKPSFTQSTAKRIINDSPYHAWLHHPRLGGVKGETTDEMDRGTLIHSLVLGNEPAIDVLPFDKYTTNAAKEAKRNAEANGLIPVKAKEWDEIQADAEAIKAELGERGIFLAGVSEAVVIWNEGIDDRSVLCRGMLDHLILSHGNIYDLKTISSAKPSNIERQITNLCYDVQAEAYCSAIRRLRPELSGRETFTWLFIETLPEGSPKRVILSVVKPSGELREFGARRWRRACEAWIQCNDAGRWPAYGDLVAFPPAWAMKEEAGS